MSESSAATPDTATPANAGTPSDSARATAGDDFLGTSYQIRWRAILLGLVLALAICALTPFNNIYRQATPLGGGHFPLAPFYILVWLCLFVAAGRRLSGGPNWLNGRELLVVWIQMVVASGIAYTGLARTFFINLTAPYHFATVANRWSEVLQPILPSSWYPQNADAIKSLYNGIEGGRDLGWTDILQAIPWAVWLQPMLVWGSFILLCYFVMICMINLLTRQAIQNERMNFPLLQVPQMMEEAVDQHRLGAFFGNRFLLTGMLLTVCLHLINGLHFYIPAVPQIPTLILAGPYFPKHGLFAAFYKLKIYIYPAFIGFAFLVSKQISLSFWFFFILGGLLIGMLGLLGYNIPAAALGVTFGPTLARPEETQMIGAYLIFFLFLFWLARHHLWAVVRQSFGLSTAGPEAADKLFNSLSFWGFLLGCVGLVSWLHLFGMGLVVAVAVVFAFFLFTLVASRVICQGGLAYFTLTAAPMDSLILLFGPRFFTTVGIALAGVVQKVLFLDLRESLMPSLLHSRKLTQRVASRNRVLIGLVLTLAAGVVVSLVAMLALGYKFGFRDLQLDWATRTTLATYENVATLIESPIEPGHWVMVFSVLGALVMLTLVICYQRFYWWPIHPIGYLTAYSSAMRILWFSFFVGWCCNALCMRYGGITLFKRLRLFFIGLILGDFLMGGSWALFGLFQDASYQVLPD